MSKRPAITSPGSSLRTFSSRFKGPALLVCRKCERKLRKSSHHHHAANLKKSLKRLTKSSAEGRPIHTIAVSCLKLCPRGAVTVCTQRDLLHTPPTLTLIRTRDEIAELYRQCTGDSRPSPAIHSSTTELPSIPAKL